MRNYVCLSRPVNTVVSMRMTAIVMVVSVLAGCNDLTSVGQSPQSEPSAFHTPAGALTVRAGAISEFAELIGYQTTYSGMITDEFGDLAGYASQADQRNVPTDQNSSSGLYPYSTVGSNHFNTSVAISVMEAYDPSDGGKISELYAMRAMGELFLVEDMCSGVPLPVVQNNVPSIGPVLSRSQMTVAALQDLDSAITYASSSDSMANLAHVLRARALLDSGAFAAASAAADSVGTGFVYEVQYSGQPTQRNYLALLLSFGLITVSDSEGINGLSFVSSHDPRIVTTVTSASPPVYGLAQYTGATSPTVVASWIEARLASAEAALAANQPSAWIADLNALRADSADTKVSGLAPLVDPVTADARVSLMFRERAFWLFGTGHRQGDLRRLIRQYGRPTESVFPTGAYEGGPALYGPDVAFVPVGETASDPNFRGCSSTAP
jgi:hypothetical protein